MVKVVSDSTCDLPKDLAERYEIPIIPLHIVMGDEEYEDGFGLTPDDIFAWADKNKTTPKTSAPSLERAMSVLKPFTDNGDEVVAFCISESMSTSGNIIRLAAEELGAENLVHVVNSENLSTGVAHLAIEAAIMAKEGASVDEILKRMDELKPLVRTSFVVDTLLYLYRGGRCSGLAALAGGALKLHPRINVEAGAMGPGKKYRGNIDKVIKAYIEDLKPELLNAKPDRIFITHSIKNREIIDDVRKYLEELNVFVDIFEAPTGGVISSHCGPGTLGLLFVSK